jgi:hypothetical protein
MTVKPESETVIGPEKVRRHSSNMADYVLHDANTKY